MEIEPVGQESMFDLKDFLESINNGVSRLNVSQLYPISGNVSNTYVGQGAASGLTSFQFQDAVDWWCPSQSYFLLRLTFTRSGTTIVNTTADLPLDAILVTYCDNFVCTLFAQIQSMINSQPLDIITTPWIMDTALSYSKAKWNFLKSYASQTRLGEGLQTRLLNVSQNNGIIEVAFRPPLSLFDVRLLPPGAQFKIDFTWASSAILAFEAIKSNPLVIGTGAGEFQCQVNSFSFYKASVQPAPGLSLPSRGIIDLTPASANQYFMTNTNQMQAQITLPPTTNRILVVFQDINNATISTVPPLDLITGVGGGYTPATSFSTIFTNQSTSNPTFTSNTVNLMQLWIQLPELGIQEPKPQYQFDTNDQDMIRAYSDWAHYTQGTYANSEGSLPYGNNDPSRGTQITYVHTTIASSIMRPGDPNNYQQLNVTGVGTAIATGTANIEKIYNQVTRWGWSGSRPGPIFCFPVVRPENKKVTQGTLYATLSGSAISVAATVIASYSMAIAVEEVGAGLYQYNLITGV